jgi:hypothetical protein
LFTKIPERREKRKAKESEEISQAKMAKFPVDLWGIRND